MEQKTVSTIIKTTRLAAELQKINKIIIITIISLYLHPFSPSCGIRNIQSGYY
jgi:uncharacterized protein YbbK (DUF523 family)